MKILISTLLALASANPAFATDLSCKLQASNPGGPRSYDASLYSGTLTIQAAKGNFHLDAIYYAFGRPFLHRIVVGIVRTTGNTAFHSIELASQKSESTSLLANEKPSPEIDTFPRTLGILSVNDYNARRMSNLNSGTELGVDPDNTPEQSGQLGVNCVGSFD